PGVVVPARSHDPGALRELLRPLPDPGGGVPQVGGAGQVDGQLAVRESLEVDVGIDKARPGDATEPHDLRPPSRCRPRPCPDGEDPSVKRRHLRLASGVQNRLNQRPYDLAMISFMISSVPAPIRASRAPRPARSTGNPGMDPAPAAVIMRSP